MTTLLQKLIIVLLAVLPFASTAQLATGTWKVYPAFGKIDRIVETPRYVYTATSGTLYSYDKDNDETRIFEPRVDLSGNRVKDIYYNDDKRYLLVVFEDANIDILPDDGERINLPDIRDANVTTLRDINDVAFDEKNIYVATSFGLVIYKEGSYEVEQSGIYNTPVTHVMLTPENILIVYSPADWVFRLSTAPKGSRINLIDKFTRLIHLPARPSSFIDLAAGTADHGKSFIMRGTNRKVYNVTIAPKAAYAGVSEEKITEVDQIFPTSDGAFAAGGGKLYHVTAPWNSSVAATIPEPLKDHVLASADGPQSVWAADIKGLGHYKIEDNGSLTVLSDKYRPSEATSFSEISNIYPLPANRGFIVANRGLSGHYAVQGDRYDIVFEGNTVEGGKIANIEVTPPLTINSSPGKEQERIQGPHIFSPTFVIEDPDDPSIHYIGSGNDGLYVIKDGKEIGHFDDSNSLIHYNNSYAPWRLCSGQIDEKGNLIIGVYTENASKPALIILPADKRRQDPSTIKKEDWVALNTGSVIKLRDVHFLLAEKSPVILMADANHQKGFTAIYHAGTLTDPSDDTTYAITTMTDQDGLSFNPDYILCFTEDRDGRVWVGTTQGLFEITRPKEVFSSDFRIRRLKVPRNDGTNLADYLLDTETVYCMAVDASNRKFIGTANSGLYLVSENGDEVIANFNTTNSPLSTNTITGLYVDPNSSSVFISTLNGLYEYSSTASPGRPDYSDVYAYPNPVGPDFTGMITIRGLVDSSLVKIMDAGMHLVYQTTSEGGMALWDGCTLNGARVKSGVYYVLASASGDYDSQGDVVAKILVVN